MNQITKPANDGYNFGYDFNYALWTADTEITLTNVPWDNSYEHAVGFSDTNALDAYINRNETSNVTIKNGTYARANEPIRLNIPFSAAIRYNYVRVYNPAQPVQGDAPTRFYYFILGARHINASTTEITVQLDIWQTFSRFVEWGRSYVDSGHVGIANEDNFKNYGRDYLTLPENIDVGGEYAIYDTKKKLAIDSGKSSGYWVLVCSTVDLESDPGTEDNPKLNTARGGMFGGVPSGASYYIFKSGEDFTRFMNTFKEFPWITSGIISITIIPPLDKYAYDGSALGSKLFFGGYRAPGTSFMGLSYTIKNNWRDARNHIPARYRKLNKFMTYPYTVIEMTCLNGDSVIIKPEMWNDKHARVTEIINFIPPNSRVSYIPDGYNSTKDRSHTGTEHVLPQYPSYTGIKLPPSVNAREVNEGEFTAMSVSLRDFPTLAIVNDGAIMYMASNANTLNASRSAALRQRNIAGRVARNAFGQATENINAAGDMTQEGIRADMQQTQIGSESLGQSNLINNIMGGFMNPVNMVRENMQQQNTITTNSALAHARARSANAMDTRAAERDTYMRDTNKSLADYIANQDHKGAIEAINAMTEDAQLIQPTTSGQTGGDMMNILNNNYGVFLRFKTLTQNMINIIGEYWLRYGYAVRRFMTPPGDLHVMTRFSYWKFAEVYIKKAPIPEIYKQGLRGILEKGVTVWRDPDDIGVLDPADNEPISGIKIDGYTPPPYVPEEPEDPVDPPVIKRKKKKMLVYQTNDGNPGVVAALAGTSPGTDANWITTRSSVRIQEFLDACGVDAPVNLSPAEFLEYEAYYKAPVSTAEASPIE